MSEYRDSLTQFLWRLICSLSPKLPQLFPFLHSCGLAAFCTFVAILLAYKGVLGSNGECGKQSRPKLISSNLVTLENRVLSACGNSKVSEKNSDWSDVHSTGHCDRPGMGHTVPFQPQVPHGVGRLLFIRKVRECTKRRCKYQDTTTNATINHTTLF